MSSRGKHFRVSRRDPRRWRTPLRPAIRRLQLHDGKPGLRGRGLERRARGGRCGAGLDLRVRQGEVGERDAQGRDRRRGLALVVQLLVICGGDLVGERLEFAPVGVGIRRFVQEAASTALRVWPPSKINCVSVTPKTLEKRFAEPSDAKAADCPPETLPVLLPPGCTCVKPSVAEAASLGFEPALVCALARQRFRCWPARWRAPARARRRC